MARVSVNSYARTHFGPRTVEDVLPSVHEAAGGQEVVTVTFSYDDLPAASSDNANLIIPADAIITKARLRVITAFAGGTSYDIGLQTTAGVEIDDDGLLPAADVALADIDAAGDVIEGSGALIVAEDGTPGTTVGTDGVIVVTENGTFTAGKAALEVYYTRNLDRA